MLTLLSIQQYQVLFNLHSKVTQNAEQKTRNHISVELTFIEGKKGLHVVVGFSIHTFKTPKRTGNKTCLIIIATPKSWWVLLFFFFKQTANYTTNCYVQ